MSAKKKILIVDDEQDVLAYFEAVFQDSGYDTVLARDGFEGFELAKSEKPDLITLDITMPEQSGLKTYYQFKKHSALKEIPVIIITAADESYKNFLNELNGFSAPEVFLNKPIDPEELLKVVADILFDNNI
ncbi:MAG: response regulator [Desulfobacterales bacterium]|uniref:Response regulator n=1 Tax=Candidatus Desulfatibia vada TaxID=2841696 RepID=A0A8J6P4K1_9BACT|nr:response regulator [Candidatus Desulfatibia vada]MBL6972257.1 response regulator [Desulfobacterales bacterium]